MVVVVVSFFDYDMFDIIPAFTLRNYAELFRSELTYTLYLNTFKYALIVWAITLVIGFTVAYFLVFHVRSLLWQIALFLLCTVPFWTSNIIRMISWIPFLGRNGIFNQSPDCCSASPTSRSSSCCSRNSRWSIAYVHLFTLFMIVPIFNSMARIDPAIIEAARDGGASGCADPDDDRHPPVPDRHRARLDLRDRADHGRLLRGQDHERRPERERRARHVQRDLAAAVPARGGERGGPDRHRQPDGRGDPQDRRRAPRAGGLRESGMQTRSDRRPWTFYALAAFFTLFVLFLYGPMSAIYILSFQGPSGGLTFPMNGVSLTWFYALFAQQRTGDIAGSFARSIGLALTVLVLTVVISVMAGLAFRRRFFGATFVFYMAIASLIMPGLLVSLGIGLMFQFFGLKPNWYTSALGAHLTWTLPFGLLIMFAVFSRFNRAYEEAARDLGASDWKILWTIVLPILLPGMIAVALFGFTLSYDEFPRTSITVGPRNTLPLEIWNMTTNVTSPALFAIGTVTTAVSFLVIALALGSIALIQRRRTRSAAGTALTGAPTLPADATA